MSPTFRSLQVRSYRLYASGQLLANYGWSAVNMVVFPPVLLGLCVLALASFARRRALSQAVTEFPDPRI